MIPGKSYVILKKHQRLILSIDDRVNRTEDIIAEIDGEEVELLGIEPQACKIEIGIISMKALLAANVEQERERKERQKMEQKKRK